MKARATVSAVMSGIGMASGQRVNRSLQVSKYENPLDGGRGPTMSRWILSNRAPGVANFISGVTVCLCILVFWHWRQVLAHRRTSELIPGQTYLVVTSFCVARMPGWESEWSESNTGRRNFVGTIGRATPVDTSQMMLVFDTGSGISVNLRDVSALRNLSRSGSDC